MYSHTDSCISAGIFKDIQNICVWDIIVSLQQASSTGNQTRETNDALDLMYTTYTA